MTGPSSFSRQLLTAHLLDLGVEPGSTLLVHTSFRAVRPVNGGPEGLIAALREALGPKGTLVMPSWSGTDDEPFDPRSTEAAVSLGIVARTFWSLPGVLRSGHQHAFAAVGRHAEWVLQDGLPLPPHRAESPVGRVRDLDGQVLLLGVNHDANTTIHLAELEASVPYRIRKYCTVLEQGRPTRLHYGENDHCCERFVMVDEWLRSLGLQREGRVGNASARLTRSRSVVDVVVSRLRNEPLFFLHERGVGCEECDEARKSVDGGAVRTRAARGSHTLDPDARKH